MKWIVYFLAIFAFLGSPSFAQGRPTVVLPIPSAGLLEVDPKLIGMDVYFPIAGLADTQPENGDILIGNRAICRGRYTGFPSANGFSLRARVSNLTVLNFTASNGRRTNFDVLVLAGCQFAAVDEAGYSKAFSGVKHPMVHDSEDHKRTMDEAWDGACLPESEGGLSAVDRKGTCD